METIHKSLQQPKRININGLGMWYMWRNMYVERKRIKVNKKKYKTNKRERYIEEQL